MAKNGLSERKKASPAFQAAPRRKVLVANRPLMVRSFGMTHQGRVQPTNEDQFLIAELAQALRVRQTSLPQIKLQYGDQRGYLFAVADGVSGCKAGEEASALAVDLIKRFVLESLPGVFQRHSSARKGVLAELNKAFQQADARISQEAARYPALAGMGTTLTLAYSCHRDLFVAHAGDSRCYLFRAGRLQKLTGDHTLAEELTRRGRLKAGKAGPRLRHTLTNVLGGPLPGVRPEFHKLRLLAGDVVLLCTDGLTETVPDDMIAFILAGERAPEQACRRLVARAINGGGKDDVTIIVARYEATAPPAPDKI
jgi:serine/threonine protein phosphatase PrpC